MVTAMFVYLVLCFVLVPVSETFFCWVDSLDIKSGRMEIFFQLYTRAIVLGWLVMIQIAIGSVLTLLWRKGLGEVATKHGDRYYQFHRFELWVYESTPTFKPHDPVDHIMVKRVW